MVEAFSILGAAFQKCIVRLQHMLHSLGSFQVQMLNRNSNQLEAACCVWSVKQTAMHKTNRKNKLCSLNSDVGKHTLLFSEESILKQKVLKQIENKIIFFCSF